MMGIVASQVIEMELDPLTEVQISLMYSRATYAHHDFTPEDTGAWVPKYPLKSD